MAKSVLANHPEVYVIMLLIDERPEEVTDMERQVKGPQCEVISSTFDEDSARHIQVSEMVLEKAKRLVEYGNDVVIFLDSITRLARAWNSECPSSGRVLSGGVDANALQRPKKFFGSARKVEEGGSLTILATAPWKPAAAWTTSSSKNLKARAIWKSCSIGGLSTSHLALDRHCQKRHAPRRNALGSRGAHRRTSILRRVLHDMNPPDAMEFLVSRLEKTKTTPNS